MNGQAIGSQAVGEAALRRLASEHGGARPRGVRDDAAAGARPEAREERATRP